MALSAGLMWALIIGGVLLFFLVIYIFTLINRFVRYSNAIDNAWAQIDVQLQRRGELIPNLVEAVKGYAKHERELFENVSKARAGMMSAKTPEAKMQASGILDQMVGRLFAVAEAYPELKANTNFLQLQDELSHTENKVSFARQNYNDSVLRYNNAIQTFPARFFAGGRTARQMLAAPEGSKAVPKVAF